MEANQSTDPLSDLENNPSQEFKDTAGRTWRLELDFQKLRLLRRDLKVDLGNVEHFGKAWGELLINDEQLLAVVWYALKDAAAAAGVDEDAFYGALGGEELEAAKDALWGAVFFSTRPFKRKTLIAATAALTKVYRAAMEEAQQKIHQATTEAACRAVAQYGKDAPKSPALSDTSTTDGRRAKPRSRPRPASASDGTD